MSGYPKKIAPNVWALGNLYFQTYLIRGEICALVEAGINCTAPQVLNQLKFIGVRPEEIEYLVVPHAHFDHTTGIPAFLRALPHLKVAASAKAAATLANPKLLKAFFAEVQPLAANLVSRGICLATEAAGDSATDSAADSSMNSAAGSAADSSMNSATDSATDSATATCDAPDAPERIPVVRIISEGDILDLGRDCRLHFTLTPGHSPCAIAAFLPGPQILFPTDCLGYPLGPNEVWPVYFAGYQDYLDSLERLSALESEILAGPHEMLLTGRSAIRRFCRISREAAENMAVQIRAQLRKGLTPEQVSEIFFRKVFRDGLALYSRQTIKVSTDYLVKRTPIQ